MENYQFNYTPFTAEDVREGQRSPFGSVCPNSHCFINPKMNANLRTLLRLLQINLTSYNLFEGIKNSERLLLKSMWQLLQTEPDATKLLCWRSKNNPRLYSNLNWKPHRLPLLLVESCFMHFDYPLLNLCYHSTINPFLAFANVLPIWI